MKILFSRAMNICFVANILTHGLRRVRAFSSTVAPTNIMVPARLSSWDGSLNDAAKLCLFEDKDIVVVYKPPSILSQSDVDGGKENLFDAVSSHIVQSKEVSTEDAAASAVAERSSPLFLIHRLDRPCSGVVVFAKSPVAATRLSAAFRGRIASKFYLCVVNGELQGSGQLHHYIQKTSAERVRCYDIEPSGTTRTATQPAASSSSETKQQKVPKNVVEAKLKYESLLPITGGTEMKPIKQTLVKIELETGRKHQIRSQLAHIGHPIVGDVKYGAPQQFKQRDVALHAYSLSFPHPATKKEMTFTAGPPLIWGKRFGTAVLEVANKL